MCHMYILLTVVLMRLWYIGATIVILSDKNLLMAKNWLSITIIKPGTWFPKIAFVHEVNVILQMHVCVCP